VAHDNDFTDLEELHGKFKRRRNTMPTGSGLVRRDQCSDIADHEYLARIDIENLCGIDPAVGAGNNHDLRRLAFLKLLPTVMLGLPGAATEPAISVDQFVEAFHAAPLQRNCRRCKPPRIAIRLARWEERA